MDLWRPTYFYENWGWETQPSPILLFTIPDQTSPTINTLGSSPQWTNLSSSKNFLISTRRPTFAILQIPEDDFSNSHSFSLRIFQQSPLWDTNQTTPHSHNSCWVPTGPKMYTKRGALTGNNWVGVFHLVLTTHSMLDHLQAGTLFDWHPQHFCLDDKLSNNSILLLVRWFYLGLHVILGIDTITNGGLLS